MRDFFDDWHMFGGKLYHRQAGRWVVSSNAEFKRLLEYFRAEVAEEKRAVRMEIAASAIAGALCMGAILFAWI